VCVCVVMFVCFCYRQCIVMACEEIKARKTCATLKFILSLFLRVTLANNMIAISIIIMISCCAE